MRLACPDLQWLLDPVNAGKPANSPWRGDNPLRRNRASEVLFLDALDLKSSNSFRALGLYSELPSLLRLCSYRLDPARRSSLL
jgi:hypothetical protein